ncbi:Hypothetical_protein [Hexamita inflata]|uniref:Hypothetical_protein n=1 Tax=Hexamita inflata TaxID=28002 RepID=A0AA86NMA5_9EUKA|nr:Hypothetical protein HINF_LOCUS10557 [Hexamita inflata]
MEFIQTSVNSSTKFKNILGNTNLSSLKFQCDIFKKLETLNTVLQEVILTANDAALISRNCRCTIFNSFLHEYIVDSKCFTFEDINFFMWNGTFYLKIESD